MSPDHKRAPRVPTVSDDRGATPVAKDLTIIVVNWRSQAYLKVCLETLYGRSVPITTEVIVVDSGSFDGCGEMLGEHFPWVTFVQSKKNLGFARANNLGAKMAQGEYLLFLNPDTEVTGEATRRLRLALKHLPMAGSVGARLLNSDGSVQLSCIQKIPTIANQLLDSEILRRWWPRSRLWGTDKLRGQGCDAFEVDAVSGACLMIRRDTFLAVGGFNHEYFMYSEDVDLGCKIRRAGLRNYHVPSAVVIHHGGNSSAAAGDSFAAVMTREAIWRFFVQHGRSRTADGYRAAMFGAALARTLLLALGLPFLGSELYRQRWLSSLRKWRAVLLWSLRRDGVVERFYSQRDENGEDAGSSTRRDGAEATY